MVPPLGVLVTRERLFVIRFIIVAIFADMKEWRRNAAIYSSDPFRTDVLINQSSTFLCR